MHIILALNMDKALDKVDSTPVHRSLGFILTRNDVIAMQVPVHVMLKIARLDATNREFVEEMGNGRTFPTLMATAAVQTLLPVESFTVRA